MIRAWDGGSNARGQRLGGAAATFAVHVLLGLALLWGLGAPLPRAAEQVLEVLTVAPPQEVPISIPPAPPVSRNAAERRRAAPDREGAAAPPNLRSEPTPVVAPPPLIPMPISPPIAAAPIAGRGSDPSAGAAPVRGPGTGAGGFGQGRGSGYGGDGGGGGGGGRGFARATPPRHISGRITEIPSWAWEQGMQGTVGVRYSVAVNGRVVNCRITRSSGYRELDTHTCDLIQRRFRFAPARDEDGEPFQADIVENHSWEIRGEPEREDY